MILEIHHPKSINEAVRILNRKEVKSFPIGGGTTIAKVIPGNYDVISLAYLNLDTIEIHNHFLEIGSAATLQGIIDFLEECNEQPINSIRQNLVYAIQYDSDELLRRKATIAGVLVSSNGLSRISTILVACDTRVILDTIDGQHKKYLGDLLQLPRNFLTGGIISKFIIPISINFYYDEVTDDAGLPLASVGVAFWQSGRTRVVLGGYGKSPLLAFDGIEQDGVEEAVRNAFMEAGDNRAASEKRSQYAGEIIRKYLQQTQKI